MIILIHRWRIPVEQKEEFQSDWKKLTEQVRTIYGAVQATLFMSELGDHVAIVAWPTIDAWRAWVKEMADHPLRQKYREYRTPGPEILEPLVAFP